MILKEKSGAFTLAEVLVTVAVIGVVASLTVPNLVSSYQDKQTETAVKKVYALLNQATMYINAEDTAWDASIATAGDRREAMRAAYGQYLQYIKEGTSGDLFANSASYDLYKSDTKYAFATGTESAQLKDGTVLKFTALLDCSGTAGIIPSSCGVIDVDINGKKAPNAIGEDYFRFYIVLDNFELKVVPFGPETHPTISCEADVNLNQSLHCLSNYLTGEARP